MIARPFRRLLDAPLVLLTLLAAPAVAAPVNSGHIESELVAQEASAVPGSTVIVALRQKIQKGWHTYWRNPGDSGDATKIVWTLPSGWKAGDIVWPAPEKLPVGPLMNYGFEGEVLLPVPLEIPAGAKPGPVTLKADVAYLVCSDICVPEDVSLTFDLPVSATPSTAKAAGADAIAKALAAAPKVGDLTAVFAADPTAVKLALTGPAAAGSKIADAYFFPFDGAVIDHAAVQKAERGSEGLTISLAPGFSFRQGPAPTTLSGVVVIDGVAHEISAEAGALPASAAGLGLIPPKAAAAPAAPDLGIGLALGLAFLGGLILNLMPCVFPVLSLKAAALAGHAHEEPGAVRSQGLAFLVGVVVTFLVLAGALLAARAAGQAVGWGFQLQSPAVVAVLAIVMLLVALNLSGVFEIGTSLQDAGSGLAAKGGLAGAFFTGVLAVVVAAPCTAPFMAGAIGFALTQPPVVSLLVFLALALGLAAPFTALSFAPSLLKRLPKPGAWMEILRRVLAFPMYAAAAWLVWVLAQQGGPAGLARLLGAAIVAAFAAWVFGLVQTRRIMGKPTLALSILAAAAFVVAIAGVTVGGYAAPAAASDGQAAATTEGAELPSEAWTPAKVAELQAQGRPVFVNFTAAWCVTCQVNDKVALSTRRAADAFAAANAVYLKGDWTNRNAEIAAELAAHGRAGVPLYLVYPAKGGPPKVLPQLLTDGLVAKAIKEAAAG